MARAVCYSETSVLKKTGNVEILMANFFNFSLNFFKENIFLFSKFAFFN